MDEIAILENLVNDDDLENIKYILSLNNALVGLLCITVFPRDEVPRITDFIENTVPRFSSSDFRNHFRLDRETFELILGKMAPSLISEHPSGKEQLDIDNQPLLFVWYLSNQESMREAANLFGISISTVHATIMEVSRVFNNVFVNMIQWPDQARQNDIATAFPLSYRIPGVIGIIDGSHIRISAPLEGDQDYVNRKGFPSVVLQVVVDDNLLITSAHTGWPGCSHDARVLRNSELFNKAEARTPEKTVIGRLSLPT